MTNQYVLFLSLILIFSIRSIAQSPTLIFEAKFDSTLSSSENETPVLSEGISFESGISGTGILIDTGDILQYAIQNNVNSQEGSMSVWVRPRWNPGDALYRIFVLGKDPRNFELHLDENKQLAFTINTSQVENKPIKIAFGSADNWRQNNWYFLSYTWNSEAIKIFVNGEKVGESDVGFEIPLVTEAGFHIGSLDGEQAFNGVMDELRIYDGVLSEEQIQTNYQEEIASLPMASAIVLSDIFGRNVTESGITLVDWEGPVRNPALKYVLHGDMSLEYPLTVNISSAEERASFNLPSTSSMNGPEKYIELSSSEQLESFLFSVYMDEDYVNDSFDLLLQYPVNGLIYRQIVPVKVIDQDRDRPLTYPVIVDFSEARDSLLLDEQSQTVIRQAAEDWLYYIDGEGIDSIPEGGSFLDIGGNDHLFDEKRATNPTAYKGYYLFAFGSTFDGEGIEGCPCSTGFPNRELLQTKNGEVVPIFRIGALHLNLFGQANTDGWEVLSPFENWTLEGLASDGKIKADLYFLAKHEIGHAMVFEESPLYKEAQQRLGFISPALTAYYQDTIVPLFPWSTAHLFGILDPASQVPPYGGGVDEEVMPGGREMLTKLDILIMESVGYPLRENEVTRALALSLENSLNGVIDQPYEQQLFAQGGIPVYHFEIVEGDLPPGLILEAFTGMITGTPEIEGEYPVTFSVKDYNETGTGTTLQATIFIAGEGSSDAELISFAIEGQIGETVKNDSLKTIFVTMPEGTDVTNLIPMISVSAGATINPGNGEVQDFSNPVEYLVTSENKAVQNSWIVSIEVSVSTNTDDPVISDFAMYPNPVEDKLKLDFQLVKSMDISIHVFDLKGRLVLMKKAGVVQNGFQWIKTSVLKPGVYILQLIGDSKVIISRRMIKI